METADPPLHEACGQSVSHSSLLASQLSIERPTKLRGSVRTKRKLTAAAAASFAEDRTEDEPERKKDGIKRVRETADRDKASEDPGPSPSKEYLAEGSEHIYRTHTCPKCRRCFKMRSHLQEHLHLHFPDPALQCPTCKSFFTSKSKLRLHRLREAGEKTHHCHLCDYSAVERNAIRRHVARVHPAEHDGKTQSFPCPACGQSFHLSRMLKAHLKTHNTSSGNRPLSCIIDGCSFQSTSRKDLLKHSVEEHGVKAVACQHHSCDAIFQSDALMKVHYRTHLAYHCSLCDFSCSNKTLFLQHQRQGHVGNNKLCCTFCSFITFNPVEFNQHVGHLHANEKIHQCSQCSFVTAHKRGLKRHMLIHSGEKPHRCSLCDFRCRDESYLSKHMLTHSDNKNFMCAECGYVTKWKHYLTVHMRKHAGDLRYQCDQCSYRCHRMDQLNSHKLRHQAKSLMCEICAYACKRKYELRNHMLAKHSGEEKHLSVYKCKYCTYTTCYRQALQNHENCRHTKLKEFRCALCFYSSFSSISLFLHKRKTHGYVPGDKAWIQNYAAKEKERNSSEVLQDFYNKPVTDPQPERSDIEGPQREKTGLFGSAGQSESEKMAAGSRTVESVDVCDSQEGKKDVPASVNSPEEYCTLVLTTLSTTEYQQEEENCAIKSPGVDDCYRSNFPQDQVEQSASSEENDAADSDRDDSYEPLNDACPPANPAECKAQMPNDGTIISSSRSQEILESDVRLRAMKKHDKAQAEAMVLEGRVQLLVVPAKDVYHCDKCSYVTSKESALKYHQQAVCPARIKGHKCPACGAQFKQKRGLDSHSAKKCPKIQRKTRKFVEVSNVCTNPRENSAVVQEGPKQTDDGELMSEESENQILQGQGEEVSNPSTFPNPEVKKALTHSEPDPICIGSESQKKIEDVSGQSFYTNKDGKFQCKLCKFKSVKLATVERHLSTCKSVLRKGERKTLELVQKKDHCDKDGNNSEESSSCASFELKSKKKSALDGLNKDFCLKPDVVYCRLCSFVAKSRISLSRHLLSVHKRKSSGVSLAKALHCQQCPFTCKQQRRLAQHEALKHKGARPHRCRFCPFSTTRRYRLDEHESLHTGVGRHSCDICEKTFGTQTKLRQHKIRIHDRQPSHFCQQCDFSGFTKDDMRRHSGRCHTGDLQHTCPHCEAQFSSDVALRNHCKRVHELQSCFSCKDCEYKSNSEEALKIHQEREHLQVKIPTCQERLEMNNSPEIQQRACLAHKCPLCSFSSKTKQLLARHLLKEHEDGSAEEKSLQCSACQFTCQHQVVLEQHLRSHGGKRLYKCTDCKYSTRNKQKITWHIRIHTGEKPYSCEQCSYTCTDPARLKLHMRIHGEEKKYLCPECGYKCKWATQLKYHMTKHTGDKPYACEECDYRTNRADVLRAHCDTQHCDLRPYVCEKCGKAFKTSFVLKTHQRQHSDDRPYSCGVCDKAFRWPAGLRHHFLSHTQQTPFRCRFCSYKARQKFQVVKHLKKHHPEESAETGVLRDAEAGSLTLKEALQGALQGRVGEGDKEEAGNQEQEEAEEEVQRQKDEETERNGEERE